LLIEQQLSCSAHKTKQKTEQSNSTINQSHKLREKYKYRNKQKMKSFIALYCIILIVLFATAHAGKLT